MTNPALLEKDRTGELADFLTNLSSADLSDDLLDVASDYLLDHLAVSLKGIDLPWSRTIAEYARQSPQSDTQAVIYGLGKSSTALAALANGTIAHGIELDDTHDPSCTHPGAVVFATALAVSQTTSSNGLSVLHAAIAGYEAMGRAGASLDPDLMSRGFHPTALCGFFGSSTAAAVLHDADSNALQSAWGLGLSMVSGSMQFTEDSKGTMVKRMHAGWPAHNGIVAVELALKGFEGPQGALDGRRGFGHMYSPKPRPEALTKQLGKEWVIQEISIKQYACCRLFHALIDAIRETKGTHKWEVSDIEKIVAFGPKIMSEGHMEYRPESVMSAQYSLPYCTAIAIVDDPSDARNFSTEKMNDADILNIADKVEAHVDPDLEKYFPNKFPGGVQIHLKNGAIINHQLLDSVGTPKSPIGREGIKKKFKLLTADVLTEERQEEIISCVAGFKNSPHTKELISLLMKP